MPQPAQLLEGRERVKAAGGRLGGSGPYGWTTHHGQLSPNWAEQGPLWLMRHLAGLGWSAERIARQLNDWGVPPRGRRGGSLWRPSSVRDILARPVPG